MSRILKPSLPQRLRARLRHTWEDEDILGRSLWSLLASNRIRDKLSHGVLYSNRTKPFEVFDSWVLTSTATREIAGPWRNQEQNECVAFFGGQAFVEPQTGWVICNPTHLVENCLIDAPFAPRPLFRNYVRARLRRHTRIRKEPRLIHLRSWGEANYWHFLNDLVGGRLRLAALCGIDPSIPVLIGQRVFEAPFVSQLLRRGAFGSRPLVVQGVEYIETEELYLFETARNSLYNIEFLLTLLKAPPGDPRHREKIFLARDEASGRNIANMVEIESVCREFGFQIAFTERMSLSEQIDLFSRARFVVAIHGAGLTNIAFRRGAPLGLLEIFPPRARGGTPPLFCWLANSLGFDYDALVASDSRPGDYRSPFHVDPHEVRRRLRTMLPQDGSVVRSAMSAS